VRMKIWGVPLVSCYPQVGGDKMCKFQIKIMIVSLIMVFMFIPLKSSADCYSCFNLVEVKVILKNGQIKLGLAVEEQGVGTPKKLSSMDKFLIIERYYSESTLLVDENIFKKNSFDIKYYYDQTKSTEVSKNEIVSIVTGSREYLRGTLVGLTHEFLNITLTQKPYHILLPFGDGMIISYDKRFDQNGFAAEKDRCYHLCGTADDCDQAYECIRDIRNLSDKFLIYWEDVD